MKCPNCGQEQPDEAVVCSNCGTVLKANPIPTPAPEPVQMPVEVIQPSAPAAAPVQYAGFWLRFLAIILDGLILGIAGWILAILFNPQTSLFSSLIGWLYFALMESSESQATLGKRAVSIKVTDMNGNRISFGRATGRYFAKIISGLHLFIGFMMAGWTSKKQALHDMIAETLVIKA
jgi:uncharacterized RDD family membrane protein YckC